ncbi:MAG: RecX family transcriptional regulator [Rhodospirillales bacterium]|nr:RecX family transcriptional regulator [Rhodospirillales bacterium]
MRSSPPMRRKPAILRPVDATYLEKAALAYLERFASSAENLRRVLMRRVERRVRANLGTRDEGAALVVATVTRLRQRGLLDDRVYAEGRTLSLHRKGRPRAAIARALAAKGVGRAEIDVALTQLAETMAEPDLAAGFAFARRRRLGPFRAPAARAALRERDLAALGRAGFSFEIARRILDAESPAALAEEIAGG